MGVELIPRLSLTAHIKDPTALAKMFEIPSTDCHHNVEDTRDEEEVGWEDELMVEEMGYDTKDQGESEWDEPKSDSVCGLEEELQSSPVVCESLFLQAE